MKFTAKQIASFIQGEIIGDQNAEVSTFAKIEEGQEGTLSFLANPKYTKYIYTTESTIVLVNKAFVPEQEIKATLIKVDDAYQSLAKLMTLYEQSRPKKCGISSLASISPSASIGKDVYIAPYAVIGEKAEIGDNCIIESCVCVGDEVKIGEGTIIYPHVTIYNECRIGNRCILHSGSVVGSDGFGFAPTFTGYNKIPQIGIVIIEDDVEIGANTCIDRATMGSTIIRNGVKLDNLIQIAHNDEIGSHTVMAAQSGVAGSSKIGQWCMIGGQSGISGHLKIGDRTSIAAQSGIVKTNKGDEAFMGSPAFNAHDYMQSNACFKRLPDIYKTIRELKKEIDELKKNNIHRGV